MRLSKKNKTIFSFVVILIVLITSVITGQNPQDLLQTPISPTPAKAVQGIQTDKQEAQVVKVADGDTLTVEIHGKKEKIRIIGINTPESVDPRRPVECFGKEASAFAKKTLSDQTVYLEADPSQTERDRYGRLLRYVWLHNDSVDFGKYMIDEGLAQEYTYEVPHKYQRIYKEAEAKAQASKKGLWADTACQK